MPRADGKPYNFELEPLVKANKPKATPKAKPKGLAVAKVKPLAVANKGGRPAGVKPTEAVLARVCERIESGLPIDSALVLEGMSRQNAPLWLKRYPQAQEAFDISESKWESAMLAKVAAHGFKDHKALTWILERRAAQRWAPLAKTELTGKNGGALQVTTLSKVLLATVASASDNLIRVKPVPTAKPRDVELVSTH
jgi:hypothetical protein